MKKIIDYLLENVEELEDVVREINNWSGSLEHLEAYPNNEDFFNTFFYNDIMGAIRAIQYGDYNLNDDYVSFNGYGNIISFSYNEYINKLKSEIEEIAELIIEYKENIYISDKLADLISESEHDV